MKANEQWVAKIGVALLVSGFFLSGELAPRANAQVSLSIGVQINSPADFYHPLSPYGTWINLGPYGRCWRPVNLAPDWRPYAIGHWEWTDSGWYWVSDEPWGWACYHYGGWELDPTYGWVWVPGTEWAPAWVTWREAPDYVGWAPCGPGGVALADSAFVFVDVHHFHDRLGPRELVFNNPTIFRRSREVGGFRRETRDFDGYRRQIAFNQGPGIEPIQRATGTRFTQRPVRELVRETRVPETARRGVAEPGREQRVREQQSPGVREERTPPTTGQERQRLYREAPAAQPAPTGREEQRIYREAPTPQPSTRPSQVRPEAPKRRQTTPEAPQPVPQAPREVPRRQPPPEASTPRVPQEQPRLLPPTGFERGRGEDKGPRRQEQPPRVEPAPTPRPSPPAERPGREKDKDRPGE